MLHESQSVVVRMAPSPTGLFHVGSLRTAIFNYLFAKKHNGTFILRIEDTDKERSRAEYEQNILDSFAWLELSYDALYRQSERTTIYKKYLEILIDQGKAYYGEENKEGTGRVIRFKNPGTTISFTDIILGDITVDITDLGDFVIARDIENPLYHFTVIVDDGDMGVTHVIRGQDHISNTPRQIALLEACGFQRPQYAHLPLILAPDKTKLSKRYGAVAVTGYREDGYTREALINFMALIGWNPGTDQEVFSVDELIDMFSLEKAQKSAGVFNKEKLDWLNKAWLGKLSDEAFIEYLGSDYTELVRRDARITSSLIPLIKERIHTRREFIELIRDGEFEYFYTLPTAYTAAESIWKTSTAEKTEVHIQEIIRRLNQADESQWNKDYVKSLLWDYAEQEGKGDVLWPLRFILSGRDKSPDPFTLCEILGKDEVLRRLEYGRALFI
ncbi:MAG: glutamate--tRNA ligase [Candidatus Pacebacteria bacterium]|nr:glutamate--tRNA ligase [Candidatus Paceibacterota bacterium]MCD8508282.1 glutamate--tRNA ligase [Candidatus Paceibacterota bacterium]MCD8528347.1 glutamate--tRNA ligase [Candidatus Paceibacterota bacterium]MCD8563994.1 glutamate--tRNA ligase [Candidatus Paceibacterota bacterium]